MKQKDWNYGNKKQTARNRKIYELHQKGLGYKLIGKTYDLHFTRVKQIIQEQEKERVREQTA